MLLKEIILSNGTATQVDDADYDYLNQRRWRLSKAGYAYRNENKRMIYMHRVIMNTPKGMNTDHRDGNPLNNQKVNLRICTQKENCQNRAPQKSKSRFKGVHWRHDSKKWQANIKADGIKYSLGAFEKEEAAAEAYNKAAQKYHGEYARLNKTRAPTVGVEAKPRMYRGTQLDNQTIH